MTNFTFLDATGNAKTARSETNGGVETPGLLILKADGTVWVAQQLAAASLPVVIASDQILATIGLSTQIGVTGDAEGSNNQHLRGINKILNNRIPATIGQLLAAASFSVVLASDQPPIPITGTVTVNEPVTIDGTVSVTEPVTVDSPQLPSTLGTKTDANSTSVTIASNDTLLTLLSNIYGLLGGNLNAIEQRFTLKGRYTSNLVDTSGGNADILVSTSSPPTYVTSVAPTTAFFEGAGIDASPRYMYIPMQGSGMNWDKVAIYVYCSITSGLGVAIDCVVNLYAVENSIGGGGGRELWSPLDTVTLNNDTKRGAKWSKGAGGSTVVSTLLTGAGSPVLRNLDALMGPMEYLVIEMDPVTNPDLGEIEALVIRERGSN